MNSGAELTLKDPNPALPDWLRAQVSALQLQLAERDAELKRRELKIQQLTLELAHHKRIRFGCKSEALTPEQRDLFVDACDEDGAAIVAELEQQQEPAHRARHTNARGRNPTAA
jgi:transposase